MANINSLKASDGTGNAAVATVQSVRAPLATTIVVDTVENINSEFHGTMGTPHTFVDPVTSETITVISEATAVDFRGHVDGGNLEIDEIADGYTDAGSQVNDIVVIKPTTQWANEMAEALEVAHNDDGTLKAIGQVETASAVNEVTVTNAATGNAPSIEATGDDTNIDLNLVSKGTGQVQVNGDDVGDFGAWQSYDPNFTGWSGTPTEAGKYTQIGKTVFCLIACDGTSNATTVGFSLPVAAKTAVQFAGPRVRNNGTISSVPGMVVLSNGSTSAIIFGDTSAAAWTASGLKQIYNFAFFYEADS